MQKKPLIRNRNKKPVVPRPTTSRRRNAANHANGQVAAVIGLAAVAAFAVVLVGRHLLFSQEEPVMQELPRPTVVTQRPEQEEAPQKLAPLTFRIGGDTPEVRATPTTPKAPLPEMPRWELAGDANRRLLANPPEDPKERSWKEAEWALLVLHHATEERDATTLADARPTVERMAEDAPLQEVKDAARELMAQQDFEPQMHADEQR